MNDVPADIPVLLGLEVLDNEKLVVSVVNELQSTHHGWSILLTRKHRQTPLPNTGCKIILIQEARNHQTASSFQTPAVWKAVLSYRAWSTESSWWDYSTTAMRSLESLWDLSSIQWPAIMVSSLAKAIRYDFNGERALKLMWIEKMTVIRVVHTETGFNSATFLFYQTVESV